MRTRESIGFSTGKLAVIGDPIAHSLSPFIQNTMIGLLGLDYVYLPLHIRRGRVGRWIEAAKELEFAGFNATIPHKTELPGFLDEISGDALQSGSVNTVCIRDGKLFGYSTDGDGFAHALRERGIGLCGQRILLLGAGGAARAVAAKCASLGAERIIVLNRSPEAAASICARFPEVCAPGRLDAIDLEKHARGCGLLVNCTPLGMSGIAGDFESFEFLESLGPDAAVCDLIYSPYETRLLRAAGDRGLAAVNGLGMLLYQAICSFSLFTGAEFDFAGMKAALEKAVLEKLAAERSQGPGGMG